MSQSMQSLTERIAECVRGMITGRKLAAGTRIPSIRRMAAEMGVSNATVVEAYDRLVAEGVIRARPGSGYYVAGHAPRPDGAEIFSRLDRAIDPLWVSRQSLETSSGIPMPGCGWLPSSWMPCDTIRRALRAISRSDDSVLTGYASSLGYAPLRKMLARMLVERGHEIGSDGILITDSASHGLDLVCRFLLEPGDTVLLDDPCYFNFRAMMKAHRVKVVGVPMTKEGPDLIAFERLLKEHAPRLYVSNCVLQNPTGVSASAATAHRILKLAERHGLILVEDAVFADLDPESGPRLAALDGFERVVQVGSFSKTLSASIRCGFVAARPDWIEALTDLRVATGYSSGRLGAELLHYVLISGSYRRHVETLRARLADAMGDTICTLKELEITPWHVPNGGMFLWCRLPDGLVAAEVARAALDQGLVLAPGNVFSSGVTAGSFMRFNVAQTRSARTIEVLRKVLLSR